MRGEIEMFRFRVCCAQWRVNWSLERKEGCGAIKFSIYTRGPKFLNQSGPVWLTRFLHYKTENRTEPGFFLHNLIGLIGFIFRFDFFS